MNYWSIASKKGLLQELASGDGDILPSPKPCIHCLGFTASSHSRGTGSSTASSLTSSLTFLILGWSDHVADSWPGRHLLRLLWVDRDCRSPLLFSHHRSSLCYSSLRKPSRKIVLNVLGPASWTLPDAQRTQDIESLAWIFLLVEFSFFSAAEIT